jgi:catechol-2,3-dioxygenase
MKPINEYVIYLDGENHSIHGSLAKARQVYRSLINLNEAEGKDGKVELFKKQTKLIKLNEHEFGEPIYNADDFADSVNFD